MHGKSLSPQLQPINLFCRHRHVLQNPRFHQSTVCGSALDRSCIPPPRIRPSFVEFSDCWTVLISIFPHVPETWCHLAGSKTTPSRRCPARLQRGIFTYQAPQSIVHSSISSVFKEPAAHWALCGENLAEEQLYISCFLHESDRVLQHCTVLTVYVSY